MVRDAEELAWDADEQKWVPHEPSQGSVVLCHRLSEAAGKAVLALAGRGVFVIVVSRAARVSEPTRESVSPPSTRG